MLPISRARSGWIWLVALLAPIAFAAGPAAASATSVKVPLPTLPPPSARYPGLFDEQGCALLPVPGGRTPVCPSRPASSTAHATLRSNASPWRRLMGFEGPYYATEVLGTGVRVMTGSVGLAASDVWTAVGMVRNDTEQIVTGIVVTARLTRPDGGAIDTATAPVAVRNVRPGEPAPFAIRSTTAASAVGGVAWAVTFRRASAAAAMSRMVEISLVRSIVLSGRDLDSSLKPTLPAGAQAAPFREVAWGMLKSWSSRTIRRPAVVALWVDGDGRAVRLGAGRVLARGHRKGRTLAALRSGEAAEFVLAVPSVPSRLDRAALRVALWETSS